jgi:hypothetical protein
MGDFALLLVGEHPELAISQDLRSIRVMNRRHVIPTYWEGGDNTPPQLYMYGLSAQTATSRIGLHMGKLLDVRSSLTKGMLPVAVARELRILRAEPIARTLDCQWSFGIVPFRAA